MEKLIHEDETYRIRGAIFDVYKEMGSGFLEPVYQECLENEMTRRAVPFVAQAELKLFYKGEPLAQIYKPDFICFGTIILEIKAVKELAPEHKAQLINYLKATRMKLGLLANFGAHPQVTIERMVL
jgi:GxxExxY protein